MRSAKRIAPLPSRAELEGREAAYRPLLVNYADVCEPVRLLAGTRKRGEKNAGRSPGIGASHPLVVWATP